MKPRRPLMARLSSLFRRKPSRPAPPVRSSRPEPKVRRSIEPLEGRIAPATLVDASTITFKDIGGDLVTIHFSEPLFTKTADSVEQVILLNNLDGVFKFSAGTFVSDVEQDLQMIDLTKVSAIGVPPINPAAGISFTITAEKSTPDLGDGKVKIGAIEAAGIALGDIEIDGDLGQIDAGNTAVKIGLNSLTVDSLFAFGIASQPAGTNATDALESRIVGGVNNLHVKGDLRGFFQVVDGNSIVNNQIKKTAPGNVGSIVIEGSLRGNATVATASNNTGSIKIAGNLGSLNVLGAGDGGSTGGLIGGGGDSSGTVSVTGNIDQVMVLDSLVGGAGANSGSIIASKGVKSILIGDDLVGGMGRLSGSVTGVDFNEFAVVDSLTGGKGDLSGSVIASGTIRSIGIAHHLTGGEGISSGGIQSKDINNASVGESIAGGKGTSSGSIVATGKLDRVTIVNDVVGGEGTNSGTIRGGDVKSVTVGDDLQGGLGVGSGVISSTGVLTAVTIKGDIVGGTGPSSGGIAAAGVLKSAIVEGNVIGSHVVVEGNIEFDDVFHTGFIESQTLIQSVQVAGELQGGDGDRSGAILSSNGIDKVVVGKLLGGLGPNSGSIIGGTDLKNPGTLKSVVVLHGLDGGDGIGSGSILTGGSIGSVTIGTAAAPAGLEGGIGNFSGSIIAQKAIGKAGGKPAGVTVFGSVAGGDGDQSGTIQARGLLGLADIRGSLTGGDGDRSGSIRALDVFDGKAFTTAGDLGVIKITGNITGGEGIGSGRVEAEGYLKSLSAQALQGGIGVDSGSVVTGTGLVKAGDAGKLVFAAVTGTEGSVDPSVIIGGQLKSLEVEGSLSNAVIRVGQDLIKAVIGANVTDSTISALGAEKVSSAKKGDVAIGSIIVRGNVAGSQILAGYDLFGDAANADASIKSIQVDGTWAASDLVAGVKDTGDDGFGDEDDASITGGTDRDGFIATIAKVQIKGAISGNAALDQFGFVAEQISSFKNGSTKLAFSKNLPGESFEITGAENVTACEVTA